MSTLDIGIVNVALPTMAKQFDVTLSQVQWITNIYLLTMVALLPFLGILSDKIGRSRIYSLGFFIFSLGSLWIGFSTGLTGILIGRVIQGIGATMIMANSQAMVREIFPNHERGRALGFNAIIISLGTLSGPALGGILLGYIGWQGLFFINVPLGIITMLFGLKLFPKTNTTTNAKFDWLGSILLASATAILLLGSIEIEEAGLNTSVLVNMTIGGALLVLFVLYERRIDHRMLDRQLFSNRTISIGNLSAFGVHLCQMASLIPLTFFIQRQLGLSAFEAGMVLAIQPLFMACAAPITGWYRDQKGAFLPIILGTGFAAVSMLFIAIPAELTIYTVAFQLALFGIGMGLFQSTNNAEIMSQAPIEKVSLMGSMIALIRYMGMIAGTGLAAVIVGQMGAEHTQTIDVVFRVKLLFWLNFVIGLASMLVTFMRPKKSPELDESRVITR